MVMYEGASMQGRVNGDLSNGFLVNVGGHHGSFLNPLLFTIGTFRCNAKVIHT